MLLKQSIFTETAGWIGVVAILGAYALLTMHALSANAWPYHVLNGLGAVGIVIDSAAQKNWQPAVLNAIWFMIAVLGVVGAV